MLAQQRYASTAIASSTPWVTVANLDRLNLPVSTTQPSEIGIMASRLAPRDSCRIDRSKSPGVEGLQIHGSRGAIDDQFAHRFARPRRVENTPDTVPGRDIGSFDARETADQRQAVAGDRAIAGLTRQHA